MYCIYSGGTVVTVSGRDFDSVAQPRITLTAVTTRFNNNTISKNETDSQVINTLLPIKQASKYVSKKHL